jgi:hypothetical protein
VRRVALISLGALALALPAGTAATPESGLRGVVLNATCAGPCAYPPPPLPRYQGDDLRVTVSNKKGEIATVYPKDGRFRFRLAHGRYRVEAAVEHEGERPSCWEGEAKRVRVRRGEVRRVRLHVTNVCVV